MSIFRVLLGAIVLGFSVAASAATPVNYLIVEVINTGSMSQTIKATLTTTCPNGYPVHRYKMPDLGGFYTNGSNITGAQAYSTSAQPYRACVAGVPSQVVINTPKGTPTNSLQAATADTTLTLTGTTSVTLAAYKLSNGVTAAIALPDGFVVFGSYSTSGYYSYGAGLLSQLIGVVYSSYASGSYITGALNLQGNDIWVAPIGVPSPYYVANYCQPTIDSGLSLAAFLYTVGY